MAQSVDTFLPSHTYNVRLRFKGGTKTYEWYGVKVKQEGFYYIITTPDGKSHKYHSYAVIEKYFEQCPLEETSSTVVGKEAAAGE